MSWLNKNQVDQIKEQIEKQNLSYSPLKEELLDHVCSDIEHQLKNGISFTDAYNKVCEQFELEPLIKIENETLEILNKKWSFKTKTVYFFIAIFTASVLFKFLRLPLAGIMMLFSLGGLMLTFVVSGIINFIKNYKEKEQLYLSLTGIFFSLFIYSILSEVLGWGENIVVRIVSLLGIGTIFTFQSFRLVKNHVLHENGFTMIFEKHFKKVETIILFFISMVFIMILYLPISPSYVVYPVFNFTLILSIFLVYGATWIFYITKPEKYKNDKKNLFKVSTLLFWLSIVYLSKIISNSNYSFSLLWSIILLTGVFGIIINKHKKLKFISIQNIFFISITIYSSVKLFSLLNIISSVKAQDLQELIHNPISLLILLFAIYFFKSHLISKYYSVFLLVIFIGTFPAKSLPNNWLLYKVLQNRPHLIQFLKNSKNHPYNNIYYQKLEHFQRATKTNSFFKASGIYDKESARILNDLVFPSNNINTENIPFFQWKHNDENFYQAEYNFARLEPISTMLISWGNIHPKTLTINYYVNKKWNKIEDFKIKNTEYLTKYTFFTVYATKVKISFHSSKKHPYRMYEWNVFN